MARMDEFIKVFSWDLNNLSIQVAKAVILQLTMQIPQTKY